MDGSDMIARVEATLSELLSGTRPQSLFQAMRHAVFAGGKRVNLSDAIRQSRSKR